MKIDVPIYLLSNSYHTIVFEHVTMKIDVPIYLLSNSYHKIDFETLQHRSPNEFVALPNVYFIRPERNVEAASRPRRPCNLVLEALKSRLSIRSARGQPFQQARP